jgi:hypothetical protein
MVSGETGMGSIVFRTFPIPPPSCDHSHTTFSTTLSNDHPHTTFPYDHLKRLFAYDHQHTTLFSYDSLHDRSHTGLFIRPRPYDHHPHTTTIPIRPPFPYNDYPHTTMPMRSTPYDRFHTTIHTRPSTHDHSHTTIHTRPFTHDHSHTTASPPTISKLSKDKS